MYINLLYLPLTLHFYSFFLLFLSFFLTILLVFFSLFSLSVDTLLQFVFQFVVCLVLFLTGGYYFLVSFVHQVNLLYLIFVGLF